MAIADLFRMQSQSQFALICFKVKLYKDRVSKLGWKIEIFVPSTGHQNCLDKFLECKKMQKCKSLSINDL